MINVPVIKTHFQAWFTMSMKAFVGMSHHRSRLEFHRSLAGMWNLGRQKAHRRHRRGIKPDVVAEDAAVAPFVNRIAELNLGIRPAPSTSSMERGRSSSVVPLRGTRPIPS